MEPRWRDKELHVTPQPQVADPCSTLLLFLTSRLSVFGFLSVVEMFSKCSRDSVIEDDSGADREAAFSNEGQTFIQTQRLNSVGVLENILCKISHQLTKGTVKVSGKPQPVVKYLSCWWSRPSCLHRPYRCLARLPCRPRGRCRRLWFLRKWWGCWVESCCCCWAAVRGDDPQSVWTASWPALQQHQQETPETSRPGGRSSKFQPTCSSFKKVRQQH